ncbi:MAG TPA: lysophospholipid acyltransferase family protein [Nocardioidaceae bacterium]|nr:lysophospholipid acyltransferase family protein [Nocardioidaceae bacterium]
MADKRGWAGLTAVAIIKPALWAFTRHEWIDADKLPAAGGCVLVANHVSHIDPLTLAHLLHDNGRFPRYLAKEALFDVFFAGTILKNTGQIPVKRLTTDASTAYQAAVDSVRQGNAVMFYPEGTLTRDPELWPMVGKTGAARVALESGAPVIPIAQWGQHRILYPYGKKLKLFPPQRVVLKVGDPVDLEDLHGQKVTPAVLREATDRIMASVTVLLEDLRGEHAPGERFDPKQRGVKQIGNPNKPGAGPSRKAE